MAKNDKQAAATETTETAAPFKFDPTAVKVVKVVTLPLLKMADGETVYIVPLASIYKGKELKGANTDASGKKMEPADLLNVYDLVGDRPAQLIVNAVLKSTLEEEYPKQTYVRRAFRIVRSAKANKRYKTYSIDEIELPAPMKAVIAAIPQATAAAQVSPPSE